MSLIQAMSMLKTVFNKYAEKDGDANTLTKAELNDLLRTEIPCTGGPSQDALDCFFKNLDCDKSGTVDFKEYVTFVAAFCALLNE